MKLYLVFLIIFISTLNLYPQITNHLNGYYFTNTHELFSELTGGTKSTAVGDSGTESVTLPFPFTYMDSIYGKIKISVNGWIQMGASYSGAGNQNNLSSTEFKNFIAPFWDDLYADSLSEINYGTQGLFPARYFIIQWKNIRLSVSSTIRKSFQIILAEFDNGIEFNYGPEFSNSSPGLSYSIGLTNRTGGINNFISIYYSDAYHNPVISNTVPNDTISSFSTVPTNSKFVLVPDTNSYHFGTLIKTIQSPDTVFQGQTNQKIIGILISCRVGEVLTLPWIDGFRCNTQGTTNTNDILNAKIYTTDSSPYFYPKTLIGSAYNNPSGEFVINGTSSLMNNKVKYYWLTYDISTNAQLGNSVDAVCSRVLSSASPLPDVDTSLAGSVCVIEAPTPVELSSFSYSYLNNTILFNWITASELNNSGFEIYRNNIFISFIKGNGTYLGNRIYSFIDDKPLTGKNNYKLYQLDLSGEKKLIKSVDVDFNQSINFQLNQNYPNPFNPGTAINFSVPVPANVTLKIYDILGKEILTLVNENKPRGNYTVEFNAANLPTGIYLYRLAAGKYSQLKKMILLK